MENEFDNANAGATQSDAPVANVDNRTEDQMLADIMKTSEFSRSLPTEQDDVPAPNGTVEDDRVPEVDSNENGEPVNNNNAVQDDTSTLDAYEVNDLDDFNVMIKINGENTPVNIKELVKGYSTDQSLSQKGRELGDARKQLEQERNTKIGEIDGVMGAAAQILQKSEDRLATDYHSIDARIKSAREDQDTYLVNELKDKKEQLQEKYWAARNEREAMIAQADQQKQSIENEKWQGQLRTFSQNIGNVIPDWSEEVGTANRDFLVERGIPEEIISSLADVNIIKFIDDFRRSEQARGKGAVKREAAVAPSTPGRKGVPLAQKKSRQDAETRDKVLSGSGSATDNDAFLRNLAARHFG